MKKFLLFFCILFIGCGTETSDKIALENGYHYRLEKQVINSDEKIIRYGVKHIDFYAPIELDTIDGTVILTKGALDILVNSTSMNKEGGGPKTLGHFDAPVKIIYLGK
jgi:hypothetical protein